MKRKYRFPFGAMSVTDKTKELVSKVVETGRLSSGRYVREFEAAFAMLIGTKEAVALSSGTDADVLALAVLYDFGANRGDEIIIPALSFVATGNAVLQAGFIPVFVDVKRETLNIDVSKIEAAITDRTKAIMPVHLMGKPADMDRINEIAGKYNLYVIEDAAEAHGSLYKRKAIGTLGDMAAYSLYVAHMISTIEGGVVVTNNTEYAEILRSLRSHGRACKCKICSLNTSDADCKNRFDNEQGMDIRFIFERMGFSSKMNELEAVVGLGNIDIYPEIFKKRRKNLKYLMDKFNEFKPYLVTISEEKHEVIGPHAFPIIVQEKAGFNRNELVQYLEKKGIDSRSLFLSMPTQCSGFKFLKYKLGEFPNAEYMGYNGLHIGVHQDLSYKDLDYFLSVVRSFIKEKLCLRR